MMELEKFSSNSVKCQDRLSTYRRDFCLSNIVQPYVRCSGCFPNVSSASSYQPNFYVNVLDFPYYGGIPKSYVPGEGPPRRWFADIRYTMSTPLPHQYPSLLHIVLESKMVSQTIKSVASQQKLPVRHVLKRASDFLHKMRACISRAVCKICGYLLFKVLRRIMHRLLVCPAQMELVHNAEKTGVPVLYLPLHRSHMDYLLVTFIVWHWGLCLPHVASGDNLNLSGFGWLLRATGAFFIHRRLNEDDKLGFDSVYRSVLNSYMNEILRAGLSMEFFVEGTRSRSGKALLPKHGLISNIVQAVQDGIIPDVFMVPVSFTYDRVLEGLFLEELIGHRKRRESVFGVFKGIVAILGSGHCGSVRAHFGYPVRLKDYIGSLTGILEKSQENCSLHRVPSGYCYRELIPSQSSHQLAGRTLAGAVAYHLVFDAQQQTSLSVTSVVSALLLCKYRDGAALGALGNDLSWLCDTLINRGFDVVGWHKGQTEGKSVLKEALFYLDESVSIADGTVLVGSASSDIFRLSYSKNALIGPLSLASAVALSALSIRRMLKPNLGTLIETTATVCELLQFEVMFCKPCQDLSDEIYKEVMRITVENGGILRFHSPKSGDLDDDSVMEIPSEEAEEVLMFFANFLRPFLQSIFILLHKLINMKRPFSGREVDCMRHILMQPFESITAPFKVYREAYNADSLHNAVTLLRSRDLLLPNPKSIGICNRNGSEVLLKLIESLLCASE